ncbi:MAG TPA: MgtC/SapB family protein [Terriglobales bacterium]|jgi:putative Mg2+ transporter-C (MgtC) family protein|nr:MgtC/SapB family protein [Terriglobales bacterium]
MPLIAVDVEKLVLAAFLGGLIGLEREAKHRSAGLRTNIFICVGAAMFTLLSDQLAVLHMGDHTRIAAQIIPGIGFIGAGSILHARGDLVTGITTASTLFVVASIGMAVGGDRYLIAIFATLLVICVLLLLGSTEKLLNLKTMFQAYEVAGSSAERATSDINEALEPLHFFSANVQVAPTPRHVRVRFECEGTRRQHAAVLRSLRECGKFEAVTALGPVHTE